MPASENIILAPKNNHKHTLKYAFVISVHFFVCFVGSSIHYKYALLSVGKRKKSLIYIIYVRSYEDKPTKAAKKQTRFVKMGVDLAVVVWAQ